MTKANMLKYALLLLMASTLGLHAADTTKTNCPAKETNAPAAKKSEAAAIPTAAHPPVFTTNTVTIAGQRVTYQAETGMLPILKPDGTTRASVFYVAYTRLGETNTAKRPVTFCFNGGPGSSSVWLHLGALGPWRVKMNDNGTLPKPPFRLVENQYSILDRSDLVFIDPVDTGYSRAAKHEKAAQFFGETGDLDSVGDFIRLWTTRHDRWLSPKYLYGESYGTFRAAGLAEHMFSRYGMYFNGLVFASGVLDFATIVPGPGNDLPYELFLPNYTATAYYFKKLPPDLQANLHQAMAKARAFARGEYALALQQGAMLPAAEREKVAAQLARFTGLKPQIIEEHHLRISPDIFRKELLHSEGLILGAYDARITGRDDDPASPWPDFDPSYAAVYGPFAAAMNAYVRQDLKFKDDLPYTIIANVQPWKYQAHNSYPSVTGQLADVMNQNPYMRILVLNGLRDLVCPQDTIRYSLNHMRLAAPYRTNITYVTFQAGHMMYINLPDLIKLHKVLEKFLKP